MTDTNPNLQRVRELLARQDRLEAELDKIKAELDRLVPGNSPRAFENAPPLVQRTKVASSRGRPDVNRQRVLEYIEDHPGAEVDHRLLAGVIGLSVEATRQVLIALRKEGRVKKINKPGLWFLGSSKAKRRKKKKPAS